MSVLFFIGNGFDVALGLKTSAKDFLDVYTEKQGTQKGDSIAKLKAEIKKSKKDSGYEKWSNLEFMLGDFTREYEKPEDCIYAYSDICKNLINYIREQEAQVEKAIEDILDDGESNIFIETADFFTEFYNTFEAEHKKLIVSCLLRNRPNQSNAKDTRCNFLNFNYTNTLELCAKNWNIPQDYKRNFVWKVGQIKSVHRTLESLPIIGVDNVDQIANEQFRNIRDIRLLLDKPYKLSLHGGDEIAVAENLIKQSKIICIFGMSLGESDKSWWVRVGNWLTQRPDSLLVIFDYAGHPQTPLSHIQLSQEFTTRDKFLELAEIKDATDELTRRILVDIHYGKFKSKLFNRKTTESGVE